MRISILHPFFLKKLKPMSCKNHFPDLVKTQGTNTKKVTVYCLKCEAEKEQLKKIIDSQISFTHVTKMF